MQTCVKTASTALPSYQVLRGEEEEKQEKDEEVVDESFIFSPSATPSVMTKSSAGRKKAPTMKALKAENGSKRATKEGRGRGRPGQRRNESRKVSLAYNTTFSISIS